MNNNNDDNKKVLKFSASWCQPCKILAANLKEIKTDAVIEEIDIDEKPELASQWGIRGVPTMLMLQGDTVVSRLVGAKSKTEIERWLNA